MHTTFNPANTDASKADKDVTVVTFMVIMPSAVIAHTRTPITDSSRISEGLDTLCGCRVSNS